MKIYKYNAWQHRHGTSGYTIAENEEQAKENIKADFPQNTDVDVWEVKTMPIPNEHFYRD